MAISFQKTQGISLISLMIGITLGIFLMAGAINVFSITKNTFTKIETQAKNHNTYRFIAQNLEKVLSQAGYDLKRFQPDNTADALTQNLETVSGWQFMGCYQNRSLYDGASNNTLPILHTLENAKIPSYCALALNNATFSSVRFFGMENEKDCRSPETGEFNETDLVSSESDNRRIGKVENGLCDKACQDNTSLNCGGENRFLLYQRVYPYVSGQRDSQNNDSVTVLFRGNPQGTIRDCLNQVVPNTVVASNQYLLENGNLVCRSQIPWQSSAVESITLLENVKKMTVLYGEDIYGYNSVNRYLPINSEFLDTNYIVGLKINLTFEDPKKTIPPLTIHFKHLTRAKKYLPIQAGSRFSAPKDGYLRLHIEGNRPHATLTEGSNTWTCRANYGPNASCTEVVPAESGKTYTLNYQNTQNNKVLLEYTESLP